MQANINKTTNFTQSFYLCVDFLLPDIFSDSVIYFLCLAPKRRIKEEKERMFYLDYFYHALIALRHSIPIAGYGAHSILGVDDPEHFHFQDVYGFAAFSFFTL